MSAKWIVRRPLTSWRIVCILVARLENVIPQRNVSSTMTTQSLDKIFRSRSVAVIGASNRIGSVGNTVIRNLVGSRFKGTIFPINPNHATIESLTCFGSLSDILSPLDLVIICTPASIVADVVRQCGESGVGGVVILTAGFREAGAEGHLLEAELKRVSKRFPDMRIIGPNCLGILSPRERLNASFASDMPPAGSVAFISQSGALCTSILDWAIAENVGFSQFVSIGNAMDVSIADLIDYFAEDGVTRSIILYIESLTDARAFMSAARAFTRTKPIIAYKAGRFAKSAEAAASHTGAMAGVDEVYEAALARAGVVRVFEIDDLFDSAEFLARHPSACGPRLAIVTNAGGPGVMATDALLGQRGELAELSSNTIAKLSTVLPACWSQRNPVDIIGDATPQRFEDALSVVVKDSGADAVLVILTPQAMTDPSAVADAVIRAAKRSSKPLLASWMGGRRVAEGIAKLTAASIPTYPTPEKCVRVFMHLVAYAKNLAKLTEIPLDCAITFELDAEHRRERFMEAASHNRMILSEPESKSVLEAYGIRVTETKIGRTANEAVAISAELGYPVVMKIHSPEISHKTDVGGVELNIHSGEQVRTAFDRLASKLEQHRPNASFDGVTIQPMVVESFSRELIVGSKRDPVFGPVILVGTGGITAELFHDVALELPPLNENLARRMLQSLQSWAVLEGYRGRRGIDIDKLIEVLLRVSTLVSECPEVEELDINPLVVTERDAIALDARIVTRCALAATPSSRFSHMAICPYPTELIRHNQLANGTNILLRPIRPEDEPMWQSMLSACTVETIRNRFRCLFQGMTHESASRFCGIDYDREVAIVAEVIENGQRELAGVASLVANTEHTEAEFAILVSDCWQAHGLGTILMDYSMIVCKSWGIQSLIAETSPCNHRMIGMFQRRGFRIDSVARDDVVIARLSLE